jgi:hypothetical protein
VRYPGAFFRVNYAEQAAILVTGQASTWPTLMWGGAWSLWSAMIDVLRSAAWAAGGGFPGSLEAAHRLLARPDAMHREQAAQCDLVRDLYGNPFRPVSFEPGWGAWQNRTVARLAAGLYEERRFSDLPVLADALEEAGCTNQTILEHCRGGREHARGCWVLDALRSAPRG